MNSNSFNDYHMRLIFILSALWCLSLAKWQTTGELYYEDRETGLLKYYSPYFYAELDPASKNYREYKYDL